MTAMQIYGGTKYIKGESRGADGVTKLQQWRLIDASTPAPAPAPSPSFNCPWKNDKPCMSDSDCVWVGGKNTCSKCHKNPGQRSICGPK